MITLFRTLARDKRGTAVVELALAFPILATMVIGITDISMAYSRKLQLEQAAQRAIEKVAQTTGEDTPEDTIKVEAVCQFNGTDAEGNCRTAGIAASDVTVTYSLTCDGTVTTYTNDCASGQLEIRYISATVAYQYTPMFPVTYGTQSDGKYHLTGVAGVRVH